MIPLKEEGSRMGHGSRATSACAWGSVTAEGRDSHVPAELWRRVCPREVAASVLEKSEGMGVSSLLPPATRPPPFRFLTGAASRDKTGSASQLRSYLPCSAVENVPL